MKCILALCCLLLAVLQLSSATPPTVPDDFMVTGEVEMHIAEETRFGEFEMGRDQTKMMGFEISTLDNHGQDEIEETWQRYDLNKTYYIRGIKGNEHCLEEVRNSNTMPKFWEWLDSSTYEGQASIHHMMYNKWGYTVGGVRFEAFFSVDNGMDSSTPSYYNRKSAEDSVLFSFTSYKTISPAADTFKVPSFCY